MAHKTWKECSDSELCISEFFQVGDTTDDETANYFISVLMPEYWTADIIQMGEPWSHVNGFPTFQTLRKDSGNWVYCGNCHRGQTAEPQKAKYNPAARLNKAKAIADDYTAKTNHAHCVIYDDSTPPDFNPYVVAQCPPRLNEYRTVLYESKGV
jgi:hypothetical protein